MRRKIAWDITTFDDFWYIYGLDRFVSRDSEDYQDLCRTHVSSNHSRRFRTKKAAMQFIHSDVRCPPGGKEGWILMKLFYTNRGVKTCEYGTLKKVLG